MVCLVCCRWFLICYSFDLYLRGEDWGESGYFRIIRGEGKCGINTAVITGCLDKCEESMGKWYWMSSRCLRDYIVESGKISCCKVSAHCYITTFFWLRYRTIGFLTRFCRILAKINDLTRFCRFLPKSNDLIRFCKILVRFKVIFGS